MADGPDDLVLVYLRRLDEKVDRVLGDLQDIKHRVTSLERQVADIRVDMAAMSARMDRIDARLDRMERRLDVVPTNP
jgi:predicted  nucleic acid-binding Zn-ribbon protein